MTETEYFSCSSLRKHTAWINWLCQNTHPMTFPVRESCAICLVSAGLTSRERTPAYQRMNSYNISYKKGPPSVYPSLIPYNVDKNTRNNVPRLIHVEKQPPCEASIVKTNTLRSSKQQDKFYIEWEKQQARNHFTKSN